MHYVYILESDLDRKYWYVGVTNNLQRRLKEHNEGLSGYTSRFGNWRIKNFIAFRDRKRAEDFEKYLKTNSGREFTKRHFTE